MDLNIARVRNYNYVTSIYGRCKLLSAIGIVIQNKSLYFLCAEKQDYMKTVKAMG